MAERSRQLYGLDRAIRWVRSLMDLPDPPDRHSPVVVFTGPRGTGKTDLLKYLAGRLKGNVPHARLDFELTEDCHVHEVLSSLTLALNRKYAMYGRLAFPRFSVGRLAMEQGERGISLNDGSAARTTIEQALRKSRNFDRLREYLGEAAPELVYGIGVPSSIPGVKLVLKYLPGLVMGVLVRCRPGRRVLLGQGQDWYRSQAEDPIDALVDLAQAASRKHEENRRPEGGRTRQATHRLEQAIDLIDDMLMAAFLADLRAAFGGRHAAHRPLKCVVLLDNADTELGIKFLQRMAGARKQHSSGDQSDTDPMVVAATSRGTLPARVLQPGEAVFDLDAADFDGQNHAQAGPWLAVRLPDLSEEEIGLMVRDMAAAMRRHRPHTDRITRVVHQFAQGHPGSTRMLVDAIGEHGGDLGGLQAVLDDDLPDRLTNGFLDGFPEESLPALITCAAARDQSEAALLTAQSDLASGAEPSDLFRPELWLPGEPRLLHPALRRLMLRALAVRPDAPANWTAVHRWLRERSSTETGRLYHSLALDEDQFVTRTMADLLRQTEAEQWLEMLYDIARAPLRSPVPDPPIGEMQKRAAWAPLNEPCIAETARLISALRIVADPLTSFRRKYLHMRIANDLIEIGPHSTNVAVMDREAERHKGLSAVWV